MTMHYTLTRRSPNLRIAVPRQDQMAERILRRRLTALVDRLECLPVLTTAEADQLERARAALSNLPGFMSRLAESNLAERMHGKVGVGQGCFGLGSTVRDARAALRYFVAHPGGIAADFRREVSGDEKVVSYLMAALEERGLITRPDRKGNRKPVTVTPDGLAFLEANGG